MPGQIFSDFAAQLRKTVDEVDLQFLTMYVYRYIVGAHDNQLREKFLKAESATFDELKKIYHAYEVAQGVLKCPCAHGESAEQGNSSNKRNRAEQWHKKCDLKQQHRQNTKVEFLGKSATGAVSRSTSHLPAEERIIPLWQSGAPGKRLFCQAGSSGVQNKEAQSAPSSPCSSPDRQQQTSTVVVWEGGHVPPRPVRYIGTFMPSP